MDPLTSQGINASTGFATGAGANAANTPCSSGAGMLGLGGRAYDALFGAAPGPDQGEHRRGWSIRRQPVICRP
jgi:hypothetical protein